MFFLLALLLCLGLTKAQKEGGYLQIVADLGVRVTLDGEPVGHTMASEGGLVLTDVPAGRHRLRFDKQGFKPRITELTLSAGEIRVYTLYSLAPDITVREEDIRRTVFMEPETGIIEILCLPVYCSISSSSLGLEAYKKKSSGLLLQDVLATRHQITIWVGDKRLQKAVKLEPDTRLRIFADFSGTKPRFETTIFKLKARQPKAPKPRIQVQPTYELTLEQSLAVVIDNANAAYPQQGLVEASSVFEMPVEDGQTYLMSVYTRNDPAQIGPIRGARDYFLEAAFAMNGTLVHVGGAPSATNRIASQNLTTIDALQDGALFAQAPDRAAPHDTFSTGKTLRDAVGRLTSTVSGVLYIPSKNAPDVSSVTVNYSANYTSGFRYLPDLDQYRWLRNGIDAADATQVAVTSEAVVVARVVAFPYPNDPAGHLYLPYSGGEATLYLRGKAISGSWTPEGGFTFIGSTGVKVDLTPFKSWILFAPEEAQVTAQ